MNGDINPYSSAVSPRYIKPWHARPPSGRAPGAALQSASLRVWGMRAVKSGCIEKCTLILLMRQIITSNPSNQMPAADSSCIIEAANMVKAVH
jgi:hypothetical protein